MPKHILLHLIPFHPLAPHGFNWGLYQYKKCGADFVYLKEGSGKT